MNASTWISPADCDRLSSLLAGLTNGEPVVITPTDLDFLTIVNSGIDVIDDVEDLNEVPLARAVIAQYLDHVMIERKVKGLRARDVLYDICRYVLPFLLALTGPKNPIGIAKTPIKKVKALRRMLSGDMPLPAATIAADHLNRLAASCIWLTVEEAASVCVGGAAALIEAVSSGRLTLHETKADQQQLFFAEELRTAGLLLPPIKENWGLAKGTADNVLQPLRATYKWVHADGGGVVPEKPTGLAGIAPLSGRQQRKSIKAPSDLPMEVVAATARRMHVVNQFVAWLLKLTSARIGELFGLSVGDFQPVDGTDYWTLTFTGQGGGVQYERDRDTGEFVKVGRREGLKAPDQVTRANLRYEKRPILVAPILARTIIQIIEVFHTDPVTGDWLVDNRLIPGLGRDEGTGVAGFRTALEAAQKAAGVELAAPHDSRRWGITGLKRALPKGMHPLIEEYAGHKPPDEDIQESVYFQGSDPLAYLPLVEVFENQLAAAGITDLIQPTTARETFWHTSSHKQRELAIRAAYRENGWIADTAVDAVGDTISCEEAADILDTTSRAVRGLLQTGKLAGVKTYDESSGKTVWRVRPEDVDEYLSRGVTPKDLAAELGISYHQLRDVLLKLGLWDDVPPRARRLLSSGTIAAVRDYQDDLSKKLGGLLDSEGVARKLGVAIGVVEKFAKNGTLEAVPCPKGTTRRYFTRESVETLKTTVTPPVAQGALGVPLQQAQADLGLTRNAMSALTGTAIAVRMDAHRRQIVDLESACQWATDNDRPEAVRLLRQHATEDGTPNQLAAGTREPFPSSRNGSPVPSL